MAEQNASPSFTPPPPAAPPASAAPAGETAEPARYQFHLDAGYRRLTISFSGRLDKENAGSLSSSLTAACADQSFSSMVVDLAQVTAADDFGIAMLAGLKKLVPSPAEQFSLINVPPPVKKTLRFYRFDELGSHHEPGQDDLLPALITSIGGETIGWLGEARFMATFLGETCFSLLTVARQPGLLRFNDIITCMLRTGVEALPIVGLISFLLGLIMAFMSSKQLEMFGANIYVASLVGLSMTRELGPIMTAIVVAGRSGSAFAAEIGAMKVAEEIDALTTMGFNPHIFLVFPKLIATVLVVPVLTMFSDILAILGGLVVGIGMLDLTATGYLNQTLLTLKLFHVVWGLGKSAVFALLIAWTGCMRGFQVSGGAVGVGRATTSAVVTGIFLIILADSLLAVILRYWE